MDPIIDYKELLESTIDRDPAYWNRSNVHEAKNIVLGILQTIELLDDNTADVVENFLLLGIQHNPRFQRM